MKLAGISKTCANLLLATDFLFDANAIHGQDMDNPYKVSTTVTNKNILVDYYTGINCCNCPDADEVTDILLKAYYHYNFEKSLNSNLDRFKKPIDTYPDYKYSELEITDKSLEAVTNTNYNITINGTTYIGEWKGEIVPLESTETVVPFNYTLRNNVLNACSITMAKTMEALSDKEKEKNLQTCIYILQEKANETNLKREFN